MYIGEGKVKSRTQDSRYYSSYDHIKSLEVESIFKKQNIINIYKVTKRILKNV